ncbi:Receptor expression-enhancing protein 5, partial [Stegodyphus mimosarum]
MFLIWCYAPVSKNGSDIIYEFLIHPFFQRNQEAIDNAINQIVRTTYSVYTNAEGYSTSNLHMRQPYQGTDS